VRALIVDDSRAMRIVLRRALSACGFDDFVDAGDGAEGLTALQSGPLPVAAFVDWNMPIMSGIEFVTAVRSDPTYAAMVIMMVTSETATDNMELAFAAGADEYVMKPFTPEVIAEKLALVRTSGD
jgi:two-component system chemotaxis response regulator CheY